MDHPRAPKSMARLARLLPLLFLLLFLHGCGSYISKFYFGDLFGGDTANTQRTPEQLAVDGAQKMNDKDYDDALKDFQQLKERYPYSKYAILADLKVGDAQFHLKHYAEAAIAYEEFARLHPRNEVVPYVLYQMGMCHFLSFSTINRDQDETRLAMEAFQRLAQAFPQSEYAERAKKQLFECQKRVVAREFYVGQFYYRSGKYASSKERLDAINRAYPEAVQALGYQESVNKMIAACEKEVSKGEQKPSIWTRAGF